MGRAHGRVRRYWASEFAEPQKIRPAREKNRPEHQSSPLDSARRLRVRGAWCILDSEPRGPTAFRIFSLVVTWSSCSSCSSPPRAPAGSSISIHPANATSSPAAEAATKAKHTPFSDSELRTCSTPVRPESGRGREAEKTCRRAGIHFFFLVQF